VHIFGICNYNVAALWRLPMKNVLCRTIRGPLASLLVPYFFIEKDVTIGNKALEEVVRGKAASTQNCVDLIVPDAFEAIRG